MDRSQKEFLELQADFDNAYAKLQIAELATELEELKNQSSRPEFWDNQEQARVTSTRIAKLEQKTAPWIRLRSELTDLGELLAMKDESLNVEIEGSIQNASREFSGLKDQLKYSGPYDDHDVILTISAGAGGTDAQDWAEMLERMYLRYTEKSGSKASIIERSPGEEAGIKGVSMEISGQYMYARLKGEHGVHRLVRLSPFNADALRQTSFAKVEVVPKIEQAGDIDIDEKDLKIDVYRSGGKGGQSVNTTDSAVRITHLPTGIVVAIQNERSQLQNKETALTILRSKLAKLIEEQHKEKVSELKGSNEQASWGNQIRNYVLHPYKLVKDTRSGYETSDVDGVLGGDLTQFIDAYLNSTL